MLPSKCRHYLECNNPVLPTLVQSYIWVCADLWLDQRCSDIKALSSRGWGLGTGCDRGFGKGRELRGESVRQGLKRVRWKDGAFVSGLWTTHYGWVVNPHFLSQKSLNERSKWYAIKKTKSWVEWPFFSVLFPFFIYFLLRNAAKWERRLATDSGFNFQPMVLFLNLPGRGRKAHPHHSSGPPDG